MTRREELLSVPKRKWDDAHIGAGYFKIDYNWYRFIKWLSGCKPEELIKKEAEKLRGGNK